jgi:methionyl-tRNA formyltransferase
MENRTSKKIKVLFCCARWLGIQCLKLAHAHEDVEIIGTSTTPAHKKVWWKDVVDEVEVKRLDPQIDLVDFKDIPAFIRGRRPDLVFSVLTDYIFRKEDIEATRYGIINLHPAPLPDYRGCNSYAHAIMNGEKQYGVTMHYVNEKIDQGRIIRVDRLPIEHDDTGRSLYDKAQLVAKALFESQFPRIVGKALEGDFVESYPQDNSQARYYNRHSLKGLKNISEHKDIHNADFKKLYDHVRALEFDPFEPAHLFCRQSQRKIYLRTKE